MADTDKVLWCQVEKVMLVLMLTEMQEWLGLWPYVSRPGWLSVASKANPGVQTSKSLI